MSLQFSIPSPVFAAAAAGVARRAPARPSHPILACAHLSASGDRMAVAAYDHEVSVRFLLDAGVDEPGEAVVSARLLTELLKTLGDARVQVEGRVDGPDLVLQIGRSRVSLPVMPAEDYPKLPDPPAPIGSVDGDELARVLKRVSTAVDRSGKQLPAMGGVFLRFGVDAVELITTDRYAAAIAQIEWKPDLQVGSAQAVIEAQAMGDVAEMFAGREVTVGVSEHLVGFSADDRSLTTTTIVAEPLHVNVPKLFPAESKTPAQVSVAALRQQLQAAALLNTDDTKAAVLTFAPGELTVEARGHDAARGRGVSVIDCVYEGEPFAIGFQPKRLQDALSAMRTDMVLCHLTSPEKPMMVTSPAEDAIAYRHLVMPVSPQFF